MSSSEVVKQDAIAAYKEVFQVFDGFDWTDRALYGDWLAQTYYYVCHVTRALAFAASKCMQDQDKMFAVLLKAIREEYGHEKLALNDLSALGYALEDFPEYPQTAKYHQSFYQMIESHGPYVMAGFALPLEGIGPKCFANILGDLEKAHGAKTITFIKLHAVLDVDHFDEGLAALDSMSEDQLKAVHAGLKLTTRSYTDIIRQIILLRNRVRQNYSKPAELSSL